jgi:hypothetical protein
VDVGLFSWSLEVDVLERREQKGEVNKQREPPLPRRTRHYYLWL